MLGRELLTIRLQNLKRIGDALLNIISFKSETSPDSAVYLKSIELFLDTTGLEADIISNLKLEDTEI